MKQLSINLARSLLPSSVFLIIRFVIKHGYFPNVIFPKNFNEKILAKILFDRSPVLITAADKLNARTFIANTIGDKYLPKLYAVWPSPELIKLDPAWGSVAIKANHGSGFVQLIPNVADANIDKLRKLAATWFKFNFGRALGEWCYQDIKPLVFAEQLLGDGNPDNLIDYKIFCFSGRPRFLKIIKGIKGTTKSYYANLQFEDLHISDGQAPLEKEHQQAPPNLDLMLELATRISSNLDMVRVDMYNLNGNIYIGELTNYPQAANARFYPEGADAELGRYWERSTMGYLPFSRWS